MMIPFRQEATTAVKEGLKKIDEKIRNEADPYKRAKLHEMKCMYGLFNNAYASYQKYKNPW